MPVDGDLRISRRDSGLSGDDSCLSRRDRGMSADDSACRAETYIRRRAIYVSRNASTRGKIFCHGAEVSRSALPIQFSACPRAGLMTEIDSLDPLRVYPIRGFRLRDLLAGSPSQSAMRTDRDNQTKKTKDHR